MRVGSSIARSKARRRPYPPVRGLGMYDNFLAGAFAFGAAAGVLDGESSPSGETDRALALPLPLAVAFALPLFSDAISYRCNAIRADRTGSLLGVSGSSKPFSSQCILSFFVRKSTIFGPTPLSATSSEGCSYVTGQAAMDLAAFPHVSADLTPLSDSFCFSST